MRRNQRKAKTVKPLERISEVIGAIKVEQRYWSGIGSHRKAKLV